MEQDITNYLIYIGFTSLGAGVLVEGYRRIQRRAASAYNSLIETNFDGMNRNQLKALQSRAAEIGLWYDALNILTLGKRKETIKNIDELTRKINSKLERVISS